MESKEVLNRIKTFVSEDGGNEYAKYNNGTQLFLDDCNVVEQDLELLGKYKSIEQELGIDLKDAIKLLKWFVDNTMIASELMEFKKSSTHNELFDGWTHNCYPIQDANFETMRDLARVIKYRNGIRH